MNLGKDGWAWKVGGSIQTWKRVSAVAAARSTGSSLLPCACLIVRANPDRCCLDAHAVLCLFFVCLSGCLYSQRWMVLKHNSLSYFKSDTDAKAGASPQGSIELDGAAVTALLDNNEYSSATSGRASKQATRALHLQAAHARSRAHAM